MKSSKNILFLFLISLVVIFPSCTGTRTVTLSAMRPAQITFPSYVKTLVVVDRTKFEKGIVNVVEGLLTGEMPGQDKAGLQETMASFQERIMSSPRFQVKMANERLTGNSITAAFPNALEWGKIEELCRKYEADAVVSIEIFDTDFVVTDGQRVVKKHVTEGGVKKEIEVTEYYARGVGNIKVGFRLYDPKAKSIVDQQLFSEGNTWEAVGSSVTDAIAHLVAKSEATRYLGRVAGSGYAEKIAPMPIRVSRVFYSKSKKAPAIAVGSRKADVNDWSGAIETWESSINSVDPKRAGFLCYNIAIAYEVLGDLQTAKSWAQRAFVDYGNKKARGYVSILENRMYEIEKVREQLNE